MNAYTLSLSDARADLETVGGKGMSLAKMLNAGLQVPGGFHVTTDAYRSFVSANGLQPRILNVLRGLDVNDTAGLEAAAEEIRGMFVAAAMPAEIARAVAEAYAPLQDAPVAVRSSATAEDLPDASFAGQQETYLNICGTSQVQDAVKQCWASLWTARAIAYRIKNNIDQDAVALAVVVQQMVFADAAGILFTANPVNGRRDELVINAAWGLGEAVVSGAVTPDTLTVKKDNGKILKREIADKLVQTVPTPTGTHEAPVPEEKRSKAVLTGAQTAELARLGVQIEQFYGMPMDVEWVLANGRFYIVQARPITALPVEWIVPDPKALYARGSLAEHTPSPVTPLFATLGLRIANQATVELWERIIGKDAPKVMALGGGFYVPLNGYVFGGVRMSFSIVKMSFQQIGPMFKGSVARWQRDRAKFKAVVEAWEPVQPETLSPTELLEGIRTLFLASCRYFTDIQTVLPAASSSEMLFTQLYNRLIKRKDDPLANVFLLGFDTVSLRSEKSLWDISRWLADHPALAAYVQERPTEALAADLAGGAAPEGLDAGVFEEWRERFAAHLKAFGRTAFEFDFANPTPMEQPAPLMEAIKVYLSGGTRSPYDRQHEAVEKREQAVMDVLKRAGWPVRGWFSRLLRWAQETSPMREDSIFDMGMAHPTIRGMFRELGRRLVQGGALAQADEIYWLEEAELLDLVARLEKGEPLPDATGPMPERKARWHGQFALTPPVMIPERSGWSKLIHGAESEKVDGKVVLKGVGTSSGVVKARARVLLGPEDFGRLEQGDVLVAVTTTPAWTPLFAKASAVVTDIGGPLSHSSIVAREYNIPAVMSTRTGTRTIQDGQMVTVDGAKGTVILE